MADQLPTPWVPEPRKPISPVKPVSEQEAMELLQSGVDKETVKTLIRDRASLAKDQKEKKEAQKLAEWQRQLDAQSTPSSVEDYQTEQKQLAVAKEYENAPRVDPVTTWDADTLAKNKQFSIESYIAANPQALQDEGKVGKLAQVWKKRHQEPITAGDVAIGTLKLPWTTAKHIYKFVKGTGTAIYDSTVAPIFGAAIPSAIGDITGQGPEFQAEILKKQEEIDKNLASDLAGLEQGSFNFASWLTNVGKTLPRRMANTKVGETLGWKDWEEIPEDQLKREFRDSMEKYLQGLRIGKGEGEFSQAVGGEFIREAQEGGGLDEDRVAALAEADPVGFFLFGVGFRAAGFAAQQVKAPLVKTAQAGLQKTEGLAALRQYASDLRHTMPPGDPMRVAADALAKAAEKDITFAQRSLAPIAKVVDGADQLMQAQLRLRTANEALKRFGASTERQAAVDAARANLQAVSEAVSGQFGAKALASIRNAASRISGVDLGVQATGLGVQAAGRAVGAAARVIESAPTIAGLGAILTGRPVTGLALLFGQRAIGLKRGAEIAAQPLRKAQEAIGHVGRVIRSPQAATPYQKALQGVVRGSAETVAEGLRGVPVDIGFALALAESPEDVQNMSGYASAFRALHAAGRPLSRFVQAVKAGPQTPQAPAFLPKQAGNLRNAAALTENWRRNLPAEQQAWVGATEQWLRDIGSDAPVYGMDNAQFKTFLQDQFQRRNGRVPSPEEQAQIDQYAQTRGVFMEEVIGDNGQPGRALIVTDAQAIPHEGMHAFQQVLGERGNQFVDQVVLEEFSPQEWNDFANRYAQRLTGKELVNWREEIQPLIPQEMRESVGGDPIAAADIYIAREIAAETFGELFKATGGRPQAPATLVEKLATIVDRTAKFFGTDLLGEARTEGLEARTSGRVLDAVRKQVQRQATKVAGERAEGTLPGVEPSGRPAVREPVPGQQPTRPAERAPNLREPPLTPEMESEFQARTPERLNINLAREHAQRTGDAELQLTVDTIAQALQRKPGEAVVFEAENLSVVPSRNEAKFQRELRRAEQAVPDAVREFYRKRIAVTRFLKDEFSGDKLQLAAMSMDKVLVNVFNLQQRLQKAGATDLTPYEVDPRTGQLTENGWNSMTADLIAYTANQANGYRGGGKELVRPEEAIQRLKIAIPEETPNYRPTVLPDRVEQYLNVVMGIPTPLTAREFKGRIPGNVKGQVLREAQGEQTFKPSDIQPRRATKQTFKSFPEREVRETNPLRDEMTKRGVNTRQLLEVTERLNMDRVRNVTPRFDLQFNLPATDVIRAGFMPGRTFEARAGEERVRLYRGQEGTSGVAAGNWWTRNPEKAANFAAGGEVFSIEVPKRVFEMGKQAAERQGQGGDTAFLPPEFDRIATKEPIKSKVIELDEGLGELPTSSKVTAQRVADMNAEQFVAAAKSWEGGLTGEAVRVGQRVGADEATLADLQRYGQEAIAESKRLMASGDFDNAMAYVTKGQFFREAYEAATGTGSMGYAMGQGRIAALPSEREIEIANRTARARGSVGQRPTRTTKAVLDRVAADERVLDFGAGPEAQQSKLLREAGYENVTAHEFGANIREGVHDPAALEKQYDAVFASNVLNVQSSRAMLAETLDQIAKAVDPEGRAIFNYPGSPRKMDPPLTPDQMQREIENRFGTVERVGGTKAEPVWEARDPGTFIERDTGGRFRVPEKDIPTVEQIRKERYSGVPEGFTFVGDQKIPTPVKEHTADTVTTKTPTKAKPELAKKLANSGVPVNQDGGISGGPMIQAMPREWRKWVDEYFLANPEVKKNYSRQEIDSFVKGMEQTAKLFGDFSMVPIELPGSPIRQNSDPMFGLTFDLTTVCPKQDQFVAVTKALETERGRIYTPQEKAMIGEIMREAGEAGCWICYGQSARNNWDAAAQQVTDVLNNVIKIPDWKAATPEQITEAFSGLKTDGKLREFIDSNIDVLKEGGELNGPRVRELLRKNIDPATPLEELMVAPLNVVVQGQAKANAPKGFSPYVDQFLGKAMKKELDFFNTIAGMRFNSQSDFRVWHMLDTAQALTHLQSQKGMAHVYTRMDNFLRIFGKTGMKFNMSVEVSDPATLPLAARVGNITYEQFKQLKERHGEPMWDDMNSFPEARVEHWRKELPNDAGSMLVAANDYQFWWGLDSPKIDMIIPFHQGAVKAETTALYGARDYAKQGQHEHWPEDWKPGETRTVKLNSGEKISLTMGGSKTKKEPPILSRTIHKNEKARYLEICEKFGVEPKFPRFIEHPNYMKLVRDVARNPMNQKVVDASKVDWNEGMKIVDEWVKSGAYEKETKADPAMVKLVRARLEDKDLPVGPVVAAGQATDVPEIIKAGKKLRSAGIPEGAFEIKPPTGPGQPSVFQQIEQLRKEQGKRAKINIKPRKK